MKKTNYIVRGILAIAVIALSFMQCADNKKSPEGASSSAPGDAAVSGRLPVAYVNLDSLLSKYNFHKDMTEEMVSKVEKMRLLISQRQQDWQKEALKFQEDVKNNVFYEESRARQEEQRIMRKRDDLAEFADKKEQELNEERMKLYQQLNDTITTVLKVFNENKKYEIIFSATGANGTILYADKSYDITNEVADFLNKRYTPVKK